MIDQPPAIAQPVEAALAALRGCWRGEGEVEGKPARYDVRVTPRLGGRFHLMELRNPDPADPYDGAVTLAPGREPASIVSYWMDSFGGGASALGRGSAKANGLRIDYAYPDVVFTNRFEPQGKGWRWTITARRAGGADMPFASYRLIAAPCDGLEFGF